MSGNGFIMSGDIQGIIALSFSNRKVRVYMGGGEEAYFNQKSIMKVDGKIIEELKAKARANAS